jgi:hypothetical protein
VRFVLIGLLMVDLSLFFGLFCSRLSLGFQVVELCVLFPLGSYGWFWGLAV